MAVMKVRDVVGRRQPIYKDKVDLFSPEGRILFSRAIERKKKELLSDEEKALAFLEQVSSREDDEA